MGSMKRGRKVSLNSGLVMVVGEGVGDNEVSCLLVRACAKCAETRTRFSCIIYMIIQTLNWSKSTFSVCKMTPSYAQIDRQWYLFESRVSIAMPTISRS